MTRDSCKKLVQFNPSDFLLIKNLSNERAGDLFKCLLKSAYMQDEYGFKDDKELDNLCLFFIQRAEEQDIFEEVYTFER